MEPKVRLRKARRVVAVQASIERLAAWRLSDIERELTRMEERRASLVRFLDGNSPLGNVFSEAVMRRLQELAEHQAALAAEKDSCGTRRREERRRLRCAELIVEALDREARQAGDRRELETLIEASVQVSCIRSEQG